MVTGGSLDGTPGAISVFMEAGDAIVFVDCCCHGSAKRRHRESGGSRFTATVLVEPHTVGVHALGRTAEPPEPLRGGDGPNHRWDHAASGIKLMRTEPTAQKIRQYQEHGFLSVPRFMDGPELEQWRAAVDAAVSNRREQVLPFVTDHGRSHRTAEDQRYYERVFTQRINLWQSNDAIRALVFQPALGQFVGQLAQVAGLRVWTDQGAGKGTVRDPTGYHLDVPFWSLALPMLLRSGWRSMTRLSERVPVLRPR